MVYEPEANEQCFVDDCDKNCSGVTSKSAHGIPFVHELPITYSLSRTSDSGRRSPNAMQKDSIFATRRFQPAVII